jgi:muramidase (phage lysozyme)
MNKTVLLAALLIAGGAAYVVMARQSDAEAEETPSDDYAPEPEPTMLEDAVNAVTNAFISVPEAVADSQVQAFLWLVRTGEGTTGPNGYRTKFGGSTFADMSDHPRTVITRSGISSSAAGAYQFLTPTWDEMADKYSLPDFSPASQDIAAVGLIKRRGALADVLAGRFRAAIDKCNKEWASLPGSPYGQPTMTYTKAQNVLVQSGANILGSVA